MSSINNNDNNQLHLQKKKNITTYCDILLYSTIYDVTTCIRHNQDVANNLLVRVR